MLERRSSSEVKKRPFFSLARRLYTRVMSAGEVDGLESPRATSETTHPLLPKWFEEFQWANDTYPQMGLGLEAITGNALLQSLQSREVDWIYIAHSSFANTQLQELKGGVDTRHRAFGINKFPKEYLREEEQGKKELVMQDQTIKNIWLNGITSFTFTFLDYAGGWDPAHDRKHRKRLEASRFFVPVDADHQYLQKFFTDPANSKEVWQLADIYQTGAMLLRTPELTTIAAHRKAAMNRRRKNEVPPPTADRPEYTYILTLMDTVRSTLTHRAREISMPEAKATTLIDAIISLS